VGYFTALIVAPEGERGQPLHSLEPFTNFISGATYEVDRLLLPLSGDGRQVDMIVALFHFRTGPHAKSLS
jgi:hypothetical protein